MMSSVLIVLLSLGMATMIRGDEVKFARDCQSLQNSSSHVLVSWVYSIQPLTYTPFNVYCDFETDGGGWTVIQRRVDGSVNFHRDWDDYKEGFGDLETDFWLGNEKISALTTQKSYELRIELTGKTDTPRFAKYSSFRVGKEETDYQLFLGSFSGNVGHDSLDYHRNRPFSTFDADHDRSGTNCAARHKGGWWFNSCDHANLNGEWATDDDYGAIDWNDHPGGAFPLTFTEMKIRAV